MCNGILFIFKKETLTHATTWINLENIMLSEISRHKNDYHGLGEWGMERVM